MTLLLVRPRPMANELFYGYLQRVAMENGWDRVHDILLILSLGRANWLPGLVDFRCRDICAKLAPRLKMNEQTIFDQVSLDSHSRQYVYDSQRLIQDCLISHPRICRDCMLEKKFYDWRWSLACIYQCPEHSSELIETCPNCDKKLTWHSKIFDQCPHCDLKWENFCSLKIKTSTVQKSLWAESDRTKQKPSNKTKYSSCIDAMVYASRPYDLYYQALASFPDKELVNPIAKEADKMMSDKGHLRSWKVSRSEYLSKVTGGFRINPPDGSTIRRSKHFNQTPYRPKLESPRACSH